MKQLLLYFSLLLAAGSFAGEGQFVSESQQLKQQSLLANINGGAEPPLETPDAEDLYQPDLDQWVATKSQQSLPAFVPPAKAHSRVETYSIRAPPGTRHPRI